MNGICTCRDTKCPLHPVNHDRGCMPCISKNLKLGEIPSCFFHLALGENASLEDCSIEGFARAVIRRAEELPEKSGGDK